MNLKRLIIAASAVVLMAAGCQKYDDSILVDKIADLEERVGNIESAIKALQSAVDGAYTVKSVDAIAGGYKITFTNGQSIELLNGKDGQNGANGANGADGKDGSTPSVEIKDGYWYINGQNTGVKAEGKDGQNGADGQNGQNGQNGQDGQNGADGKDGHTPVIVIGENGHWYIDGEDTGVSATGAAGSNGQNGDSFLLSIYENKTTGYLVIILNDEEQTTFQIPLEFTFSIGSTPAEGAAPENHFNLELGENEIPLNIPANDNIATVRATLYHANGVSNSIVTKGMSTLDWTVKLAKDYSYVTVIVPESAPKGTPALLEIAVVLNDGKTYTSSKALVYCMTLDQAMELFAAAYEDMQRQWTMVYNSTVNFEEDAEKYGEREDYQALVDEVSVLLSAISQTIVSKMTWATESYDAETLIDELDEILASFEADIQIPLTQALNIYNAGILTVENNIAFETFEAEYRSLQQQYTMAYNATVGNEENNELYAENEAYEALVEQVSALLSGIAQTIETKMTWATESYEALSLAEELEELLLSFESDVQIPLTQALNVYNSGILALDNDLAFEAFNAEYESWCAQYTQIYNVTFGSLTGEEPYYGKLEDELYSACTALMQVLQTKMTWAEESYEAETLAVDLEEILSTIEADFQIPATQFLNAFNDRLARLQLIESSYEEIMMAISGNGGLEAQWTQVYNVTYLNEEYEDEIYTEKKDELLPILTALTQQIEALKTWATESYEAETLPEDLDEIYASFEPMFQIPLSQYINLFNDTVGLYKHVHDRNLEVTLLWTETLKATVSNPEYTQDERYTEFLMPYTLKMMAINREIGEEMTAATAAYKADTLAEVYATVEPFEQEEAEIKALLVDFQMEVKKLTTERFEDGGEEDWFNN